MDNQTNINQATLVAERLIKKWEGCHRKLPNGLIGAYICPTGYPTQGWGIVVPSLDVPPITQQMADAILRREIPRYMSEAAALSPVLLKPSNADRLGAITSFVFNLGGPRYRASTLRKRINAEDWDGAKIEIVKWNKGKVNGVMTSLRGLTARRQDEAKYL